MVCVAVKQHVDFSDTRPHSHAWLHSRFLVLVLRHDASLTVGDGGVVLAQAVLQDLPHCRVLAPLLLGCRQLLRLFLLHTQMEELAAKLIYVVGCSHRGGSLHK